MISPNSKYLKAIFRLLLPNLPLFGALLVLQSIQLCISYCLIDLLTLSLVAGSIAWTYILTLPLNFVKSRIYRRVYTVTVFAFCSLSVLIELFCAIKLKELVNPLHIELIANTNFNESVEFFSLYIDFKFTAIIVGISILVVCVYLMMKKVDSSIIKIGLTVISFFSMIITIFLGVWHVCGIGQALDAIMVFHELTDYKLSESQIEFEISETHSLHPNIILIIGESFDKKHSCMYGYDKETNPLLSERQRDSSMIVFTSVESPAPNTNLSIRQMLSLSEQYDDDSWYEKPMLFTALRKAGYDTRWLSNQSAKSLFDYCLGEIANLCDSVVYTSNEYLSQHRTLDDVLFHPFEDYIKELEGTENNFCVLHLMGSHGRYDLRYPNDFSKFLASDYPIQPEHRRETFATYDNSILYNDYVVDSLMKISDNIDAIVIYAPDHGQDFYYTGDIAGHGIVSDHTSFEAGCQIPFMIYFTKSFRENHPGIVEHTRSLSQKEFNTKYLMNTIMDMAGYDISDATILDRSLFRGKFSDIPNAPITTQSGK